MILIQVSKVYIFQHLANFLTKFLIISVLHRHKKPADNRRN